MSPVLRMNELLMEEDGFIKRYEVFCDESKYKEVLDFLAKYFLHLEDI